jgi:nucleoside-triphosphatase THEP1
MNLDDYKTQATRKILVYGAPKSGKTALVGKLAEKYKLHWFDLEGGIKTLLNPEILKPEYRKNFSLFSIPDKQTYPIAIETVLKTIKGTATEICQDHGRVSCPECKRVGKPANTIALNQFTQEDIWVIDSWSQLCESAMNYIMKDAIAKDNFDAKAGWDEYGKQGRILERIGSFIQIAPINIVVISHELLVEMEDKSKKIVPIGGTSNFSKTFAKYFDDVVYCELLNKSHRAVSSTVARSGVLAGSRNGVDIKAGEDLFKLFEEKM